MKKIAIVSDFSKTLTSADNPTTWSVFAKSGLLWEDYIKERDKFFDIYYKYELASDVEKTKKWWKEHLNLFVKYWLNQDLIKKIISDEKYFKARKWLNNFFDIILSWWVKIMIITSSWVSNFVKEFLEYKWINTDNIEVIGNSLEIDDNWKVIWYKDDIITSLNKWEYSKEFLWFDKVILLWDDKSDLDMAKWNNVLKIWFCDEQKAQWYDIYLWKDWSLEEVLKIVEKFRK